MFDKKLLPKLETLIDEHDENVLFSRQYFLDYHAQRFSDQSVLYEIGEQLVYFPAAKLEGGIVSHPGVTYGGLVVSGKVTPELIRDIYKNIEQSYADIGITDITIKLAPKGFKNLDTDCEAWALNSLGFEAFRLDLWNVVDVNERKFSTQHKRNVAKFKKSNLQIIENWAYNEKFYEILVENLASRHSTKPVHTLMELQNLKNRLGDRLKLLVAVDDASNMHGGIIVFQVKEKIFHAQYIASSTHGKLNGAVNSIFDNFINNYCKTSKLSYGGSLVNDNYNYNLYRHKLQMNGAPQSQLFFRKRYDI